MISPATYPSEPRDATHDQDVDALVVGGGIIGLVNALQLAKRGVTVAVADETTERERESYKVGESLLVYVNAFLRVLGEVDDELNASRVKAGIWMARGIARRLARTVPGRSRRMRAIREVWS